MRDDVREAVEAGAGVLRRGNSWTDSAKTVQRREAVSTTAAMSCLRAILQELPDDMTVIELRDEIQSGLVGRREED